MILMLMGTMMMNMGMSQWERFDGSLGTDGILDTWISG